MKKDINTLINFFMISKILSAYQKQGCQEKKKIACLQNRTLDINIKIVKLKFGLLLIETLT